MVQPLPVSVALRPVVYAGVDKSVKREQAGEEEEGCARWLVQGRELDLPPAHRVGALQRVSRALPERWNRGELSLCA